MISHVPIPLKLGLPLVPLENSGGSALTPPIHVSLVPVSLVLFSCYCWSLVIVLKVAPTNYSFIEVKI